MAIRDAQLLTLSLSRMPSSQYSLPSVIFMQDAIVQAAIKLLDVPPYKRCHAVVKSYEDGDTDSEVVEGLGVAVKARPNDNVIDEELWRNAPASTPALMQKIRSRLRDDSCNCGGVRKFSLTCTEAQAEHLWVAINSSCVSALVDPNINQGDTHSITPVQYCAAATSHGGNGKNGTISSLHTSKIVRVPFVSRAESVIKDKMPLDPWLVGLHLGVGDQKRMMITTTDDEIEAKMQEITAKINESKPLGKELVKLKVDVNPPRQNDSIKENKPTRSLSITGTVGNSSPCSQHHARDWHQRQPQAAGHTRQLSERS